MRSRAVVSIARKRPYKKRCLWEERERRRLEILTAVDNAEASLARGEGRVVTTYAEAVQLASNVERRGLARTEAEHNSR